MRCGVRGRGVMVVQAACAGWPGSRVARGGRARAERTRNIHSMVVTVDVSKLSAWLNADASCRVETRAYDAGRGAAAREA
eukprot:scaffold10266_cov58-Phaeocystis_antarctica.AAC.2